MPFKQLETCDILVVKAADEFKRGPDDEYFDPLQEALKQEFELKGRWSGFGFGCGEFLAELRAHKLFLEDRDRFWRLHPALTTSFSGAFTVARFKTAELAGKKVCFLSSELRLNTDGPTAPVLRMLPMVLRQTRPRFVVYLGLAAGTRGDQMGGDVVVTTRALFGLRAELEGLLVNGEEFGRRWTPDPTWFVGLTFPQLQEPGVLAASPNYESEGLQAITPHVPQVRLEPLPVLTRPRVTDTIFDIPSPHEGQYYFGDRACAVDMDAAPVAAACLNHVRSAYVLGLATPPIIRFENDYEGTIRRAWLDAMMDAFAEPAAINAVQVLRRVLENAV